MSRQDHYNLERFVAAQERDYHRALAELERGRKESHWIWYIFPQVAGLGHSAMAQEYAIGSKEEGVAYLSHPVLGSRLRECCNALLKHKGKSIESIMGYPDDLKLRSSMTLFAMISEQRSIFQEVLNVFYSGEGDRKTLESL